MKISNEKITEICNKITGGLTQKQAALLSGIEEKTFYNWMAKGKRDRKAKKDTIYVQFLQSLKKALIQNEAFHIQNIVMAAKGDTELGLKPVWQASAWWLERRWPDKYGHRVEVTGKKGKPIEHAPIVIESTDDRRARLLNAFKDVKGESKKETR